MTEKNAKIRLFDRTEDFSPITDTIGQLNRPVQALGLLDKAPLTNWSTAKKQGIEKQLQQVVDDYTAIDPDLDVDIYYGSGPNMKDMAQTASLGKGRLLSNLLSIPADIVAASNRGDHFQPLRKSITLFNPSPEALRHELGHALDTKKNYGDYGSLFQAARTLASVLPFELGTPFILGQEGLATKYGLDSIAPNTDVSRYTKITGGGLGSYAGGALGSLLGSLVAPRLLKIQNPLTKALLPILGGSLGGISGGLLGSVTGSLAGDIVNKYRNSKIEDLPTAEVLPEPVSETPESANKIPEVKAASFRSSLSLFKQAEREANAAMMKELYAEGGMDPAVAGMDPEEIDPEVAAAINDILMQLGNGQEEAPEDSSENFATGEADENDEQNEKHTVEKASALLPLFEQVNSYGC